MKQTRRKKSRNHCNGYDSETRKRASYDPFSVHHIRLKIKGVVCVER